MKVIKLPAGRTLFYRSLLLKEMTGGPAADRPQAKQLAGNGFHRAPILLLSQQVFHLGRQAALKPFRAALAGTLDGQAAHQSLIAGRAVPGIITGMACFRRHTSQGNQNFAFQPVVGRPKRSFTKFVQASALLIGNNRYPVHEPAQRQGYHSVPGFVIGGGFIRMLHGFNLSMCDVSTRLE